MKKEEKTILVIGFDEQTTRLVRECLSPEGYCLEFIADMESIMQRPENLRQDLVLINLEGAIPRHNKERAAAITRFRELHSGIKVIAITDPNDGDFCIEAIERGADDCLSLLSSADQLSTLVMRALNIQELERKARRLREGQRIRSQFKHIIGRDPTMLEMYSLIRKCANTSANILLRGESGTGKELVASAIHSTSDRLSHPLVTVNCAALSEGIKESELFGHERGAFTDAKSRRLGYFEAADGGTIFLDEIGDIPISTQVKLLRIIEHGEFQRVGSSSTIKVDVRIISATNRELERMIQEGSFREDLFYRLNGFSIVLPPLRSRRTDISLMARHFIEKACRRDSRPTMSFTDEALEILARYNWPGNVRELENEIQHIVIQADGAGVVTPNLLSHKINSLDKVVRRSMTKCSTMRETLQEVERWIIKDALRKNYGNKTWSARHLGITREWLHKRMSKYSIRFEDL